RWYFRKSLKPKFVLDKGPSSDSLPISTPKVVPTRREKQSPSAAGALFCSRRSPRPETRQPRDDRDINKAPYPGYCHCEWSECNERIAAISTCSRCLYLR